MKGFLLLFAFVNLFNSLELFSIEQEDVNIQISPAYFYFDEMKIGDPPQTKEFTLYNASDIFIACIDSIYLKNQSPSLVFDITGLDTAKSLMPKENRTFTVTFTLLHEDAVRDTLVFLISNCQDEPVAYEIMLADGHKLSTMYVGDLEFEEREIGSMSEFKEMTITNSSENGSMEKLIISQVKFSGNINHLGHGVGFKVDGLNGISGKTPLIIEVDESYTFKVRFMPGFRGEYNETIYFESYTAVNSKTKTKCNIRGIGLDHKTRVIKSYIPEKNKIYDVVYKMLFISPTIIDIEDMDYSGDIGSFGSNKTIQMDQSFLDGSIFPLNIEASEWYPLEFKVNFSSSGSKNAELKFVGDYFEAVLRLDFCHYDDVETELILESDTFNINRLMPTYKHFIVKNNSKDQPLIIYGVEYSGLAGDDLMYDMISSSQLISLNTENYKTVPPGKEMSVRFKMFSYSDGIYDGQFKLLSNSMDTLEANIVMNVGNEMSVADKYGIEDYRIYYNENENNIFINFNNKGNYKYSINVYNLNGEIVKTKNVKTNSGNNEIIIDANNLPTGSYFIQILSGEKLILSEKILIY